METTAGTNTQTSATTQKEQVSVEGAVSKKALIAFLTGATIVFTIAIYYCVTTNHAAVGGALGGAYALVCVYAASIARSFK